MRRVGFMAFAALVSATVVCAPALATSETKTVGAKWSGKTVQIKPGSRLEIMLGGASASTGYSWNLTQKPDPKVLRVVTNGKLENAGKCATHDVGCPQNTVFVFAAVGATNATTGLKLVLLPPGRRAKAVKTFTLTVHV